MAEQITYDNLNMELVVWYNGTVNKFVSEVYTTNANSEPIDLNQNSTKLKEYADKVILITGSTETNPDTAGKAQAIFISKTNANGVIEGKLMKLSDIPGYIAGINVGGTNHVANGDVILKLVGNGITISVNPEGTVNFDASTLVSGIGNAATAAAAADKKAQDALNAIETLTGGSGDGTIADIVSDAIAGVVGKDGDEAGDDTIKGAKKYADEQVGALETELFGDGTKILEKHLPDYILGQLKFGGTIGNTETSTVNQKLKVSPTSSYIDEFKSEGITGPFDITTDFNSSGFDPSDNEGWYFIVKKPNAVGMGGFGWDAINGPSGIIYKDFYDVGDWFLSTGEAWEKIDNTDSVTSVADFTGAVTIGQIKGKLTDLGTEHFDDSVNASLANADTAVQSVKAVKDNLSNKYLKAETDGTTVTIDAHIRTMSSFMPSTDGTTTVVAGTGTADAKDIYDFIKARLSIRKV